MKKIPITILAMLLLILAMACSNRQAISTTGNMEPAVTARSNVEPAQAGTGNTEPPLLIEFGDFQCPHCANFAESALPRIKRDFIDTGLIKYEYRHFPVLGPNSYGAALASECAREKGKFDLYHDLLFERTRDRQPLNIPTLNGAAAATGLEPTGFSQCLSTEQYRGKVLEDYGLGEKLGVQGTPTLVINNRVINWRNYDDLADQLKAQAR